MRRPAILIPLLLLLPLAAHAASIVAWDIPTMTAYSTHVVEATVEAVTFEEVENGIQTRNTLRVERYLVGSGPDRIDVLQAGGTLGEHTMVVSGDFRLEPGQRTLLFLREGPGPEFFGTLLGWSAFTIDGRGPDAAVARQVEGLATFAVDTQGVLVPVDPRSIPTPSTLRDLRASIAQGASR